MTATLDLSDTQRQMLDAAQALLDAHYPLDRLHRGGADDLGPLAAFGAVALTLPEDAGGAGMTPADEALLHARLGTRLLPPAAFAAPVAARLMHAAGEMALATALADGRAGAAAAVAEGADLLLPDPPGASVALWCADGALFWRPLDGAAARPVPAAGGGTLWRLAGGAAGRPATDAARLHWQLLAAAHLLGAAEGARDLAVAHALMREQFGRPIGAFQAVKHRCADMALAAEALSAQLDFAALALAERLPDAAFQVAALVRLAPKAALANARAAIQLHGGLGFSAEALPHRFLAQARRLSLLIGTADLMGEPAPLAPLDGDAPCAQP